MFGIVELIRILTFNKASFVEQTLDRNPVLISLLLFTYHLSWQRKDKQMKVSNFWLSKHLHKALDVYQEKKNFGSALCISFNFILFAVLINISIYLWLDSFIFISLHLYTVRLPQAYLILINFHLRTATYGNSGRNYIKKDGVASWKQYR